MCDELETAEHRILGCGETAGWKVNLVCEKLLNQRKKL
jgi:hypothetical protein